MMGRIFEKSGFKEVEEWKSYGWQECWIDSGRWGDKCMKKRVEEGEWCDADASIGNESVPKIIINDTIIFFETAISILDFWYFQIIPVSKCCLIKLLPYILFAKIHLYFSIEIENGQHREPALCQLYRHTSVAYDTDKPVKAVITRRPSKLELTWSPQCFKF